MKAKRRIILAAVIFALAGVLVAVMLHHARTSAHRLIMLRGMDHLGTLVEDFRLDHGQYPSSLQELLLVAEPLDDAMHDYFLKAYDYQALTDGFRITVNTEKCEYRLLTNGYNVVVGGETSHVTVTVGPTRRLTE